MDETVLACDIGGTHLRLAIVDTKLRTISSTQQSVRGMSYQEIIRTLKDCVANHLSKSNVGAIGVSLAGHVDTKNGTVAYRQVEDTEPKPKEWQYERFNLVAELQQLSGLPVAIENDGNAALYAEWQSGVAKGYSNVIVFVLGTYIGSGVLANNEIIRRRTSGPMLSAAITRYGQDFDYLGSFPSGVGLSRASKEVFGQKIQGDELFALLTNGTPEEQEKARGIFSMAGEWLGVLVTNAINMFDPEMVVLDGPIMHARNYMMPAAEEIIASYALPGIGAPAKVQTGTFVDNASLVGASLLAIQKLR